MNSNEKSGLSRRDLLKAAAGLGAGAAVGVPAMVFLGQGGATAGAMTRPNGASAVTTSQSLREGPVVAYIRDASKGEVAVMFGEQEVVVRDQQLVARILGAIEG